MKMNTNNRHNAVFPSPLPVLIILIVIILAFAGKLNAGEKSGKAQSESVAELQSSAEVTEGPYQETDGGQYERYYRTLINDPVDGQEKLVELRYTKDGRLTEVLIDDRTLTRAERRKHEKIIRKAMAEERNAGKEIDELIDGLGRAVDETMGVVSDVFDSIFEDKPDISAGEAESPRQENLRTSRKRDRAERLTTLENLESGKEK